MTSFEDVLARCLSDIESGKATMADCLTQNAAQADALRPLLQTAVAIRTASQVNPSPAFESAAGARMANLIAQRQSSAGSATAAAKSARRFGRWTTLLLRVTAIVVAASVLLGGTAYAAQGSLPDSPLYPVERTVEQVKVIATPNQIARAKLFAGLMDRRAAETSAMVKRNKPARALETGAQYVRLLREASAVANRIPADNAQGKALLVFLRGHLVNQQGVLQRQLANDPGQMPALLRGLIQSNQRAIDSIDARLQGVQTTI